MSMEEILQGLGGWVIILAILYFFVKSDVHPSRPKFKSYLLFLGIFFGIVMSAIFVAVATIYALGMQGNVNTSIGKALGPLLAFGAVIPAWRLAKNKIKTPIE